MNYESIPILDSFLSFYRGVMKSLFEIWWPIVKPMVFAGGVILFVLFICPLLLKEMVVSLPYFNPIEQITTPHTKTTNTLSLSETNYWSTKRRHVDLLLITDENLVILRVRGSQGAIGGIVVLDVETEKFFWRATSNTRSLDADRERVYVGGVDDVQAFDLKTGEKLWDYVHPSQSRGGLYVHLEEDTIKAYVDNIFNEHSTEVLTLDPQTGELLDAEKILEPFSRSKFAYKTDLNTELKYVIEADGRIVGLDNQTGQEIGYLEMTSPSIYDKVAASDEFLVVYNDNNQELIVFKQEN